MIRFNREELLAPRPTPKLEDHPLSVVSDCLFNIFAATLHIGGRSSIRNLMTRRAVVTGTIIVKLVIMIIIIIDLLIEVNSREFWLFTCLLSSLMAN